MSIRIKETNVNRKMTRTCSDSPMCRQADIPLLRRAVIVAFTSFNHEAEFVKRRNHEHGHDRNIRDALPLVIPRWQHGSELGKQLTAYIDLGDVVGDWFNGWGDVGSC